MTKFKPIYLITISVVLFALFLINTAWFNRYSADDFYFIGELKTKSFSELYHHLYFNWHGRWTSNFLQVFSFQLAQLPKSLFVFNLTGFMILFFCIQAFLKTVLMQFKTELNQSKQLIFSGVFMMVFFFCCVEPSSSWFWHTSTVVYLWSVAAFLLMFSIVLKNIISPFNYLLLLICSIYLGGSNEPMAIISMLILGYLFYKNRNKNLVISLLVLLSAFVINYFSSGTNFRDEITPGLSFIDLILYTSYGSIKFLLFDFYKTFLPAIFLSIPFYWLGKQADYSKPFQLKKELLASVSVIVSVIIINQFLVIYPLGGLAPNRSTTASSILIAIVIIRFFFLWGISKQQVNLNPILYINAVGMVLFLIISSYLHFNYAKAYDERMVQIAKVKKAMIKLNPLPYSGFIYSAEITTDKDHFLNQHLKNGLDLKQDVMLEN